MGREPKATQLSALYVNYEDRRPRLVAVMERESEPAELVGIDPTTLEVVDAIDLGVPVYQPVAAFDSVWFEHGGVLTRISAESLEGS